MVNSSLFRRIQLQMLMNLTAKALRQPPLRLWTRPNAEALHEYATFTYDHLKAGTDEQLLQRMNDGAYRMGRLLRRLFFVRKTTAAERLITALYRNIGIELSFSCERLCFHRCFFGKYYTPEVCLAASALDEGIIRGLTGMTASRLLFSQRITEGCNCCKATFQKRQNSK